MAKVLPDAEGENHAVQAEHDQLTYEIEGGHVSADTISRIYSLNNCFTALNNRKYITNVA